MRKDVRRFAELAGMPAVEARPAVPWEQSPKVCGIEFPADYREFVDTFGGGTISDYIAVEAPVPPPGQAQGTAGLTRFAERAEMTSQLFEGMRDGNGEFCPYSFFPQEGGLLEWGSTIAGDTFFWLTRGSDPMEWPVVVWYRGFFDEEAWCQYDMPFVAFLLHGLSGKADENLTEMFKCGLGQPLWEPA